MKYPEQILFRLLSATPSVARHLGFDVYPMLVPSSAELPFATYQRSSIERLQTLAAAVGVPTSTIELDIYCSSYSQARELGDEVKTLLDHYRGTTLGVTVANVTITNESEDVVQLEGGDLPPAWQVTFDLDVQWEE